MALNLIKRYFIIIIIISNFVAVLVPLGEDPSLECNTQDTIGGVEWSFRVNKDAEPVNITAADQAGSSKYQVIY